MLHVGVDLKRCSPFEMDDEDEVDIVGEFNGEAVTLLASGSCDDEMGLNISEFLPYFGSNSWLLNTDQVWSLDNSIDSKSKAAIEKVLQEDGEVPVSKEVRNTNVAASSHKQPWTNVEKEMFHRGLKIFGHSWTKISKYLGTRTTLQVKNFARQYLKHAVKKSSEISPPTTEDDDVGRTEASFLLNQSYETATPTVPELLSCPTMSGRNSSLERCTRSPEKPILASKKSPIKIRKHAPVLAHSKEIVRLHKGNSPSDDEDVDIENVNDSPRSDSEACDWAAESRVVDPVADVENCETDVVVATETVSNDESIAYSAPLSPEELDTSEDRQEGDQDLDSDGDIGGPKAIDLVVPQEELVLGRNAVTEQEKLVHREFFEGRSQKTPERYLKIRNFILDSWERSKPVYLNKTSVRPGLKNCGDVNCIGRIHMYLEQIGAINFGCEQTIYHRPFLLAGRPLSVAKKTNSGCLAEQFARIETMRPRKRKVPVFMFDPEKGGYTIQHGDDGEIIDIAESVETADTVAQKRHRGSDNPFRLVLCSEFTPSEPAPFTVRVHVDALVMMDIHAHMSILEVIGLLGGYYDEREKVLHVQRAEPCESSSTGLECEMDPVSQTLGSERLQNEGYQVVGWYHSHPTFAPNPSLRDLETQAKYQEWFNQGGAPFLGVIISPHSPDPSMSSLSKLRYLIVGEDVVQPEAYRKPFKFKPTLVSLEKDVECLIDQIHRLLEKWEQQAAGDRLISVKTLNKMIGSVYHHLMRAHVEQEVLKMILGELGKMLLAQLTETESACFSNDEGDTEKAVSSIT